jgi:hypothetical protein
MGSNSIGQGSFLADHPDVEEINRMLNVGNTPEEVSNWLKTKYKQKRYWASPASVQNYRKNVLQLSKAELGQRRAQLLAEGKTKSANGLALHQTTTELIETKEALKSEMQNVIDGIKEVQGILKERMTLAQAGAVNDMGQPVFKRNNDEMIARYLDSYRAGLMDLFKMSKEMVAPDQNQTNITITTAEVQKYAEAFKEILQRLIAKFDPSLLPEVFKEYDEAMAKLSGQASASQVQISMTGSNNQINIVTGAQAVSQLPTVEEVDVMASQMTNENDYIADESTINTVIETKINN